MVLKDFGFEKKRWIKIEITKAYIYKEDFDKALKFIDGFEKPEISLILEKG